MKPNILFILADDLGCRDLGSFGSSFYETPELDALASKGLRFENAYASCPVCSPTRASILSGKYPARVGITQWIGGRSEGKLKDVPYLHYLPLEEKSLATSLRESGYQTWHVGKWHLGDEPFYPEHHGFDVNIGGCHQGGPGPDGYWAPYPRIPMPPTDPGTYLTDQLTDEAIHLMKNRDPHSPFFLHLSHYAVHTPIQAPPELVEKYRRKAEALGLDKVNPFEEGKFHPCLHNKDARIKRRKIQSDIEYAAMIENLDWNVGRVLASLREQGLIDNTLIVFTSDNGGLATSEGSPTCNLPFIEGKGWNYEGGTRICQFMTWPGVISPGSSDQTPVISTDFYPTFLEAAGQPLQPEQHCDGVSLMPLLTGSGTLSREAIFWHYPHYSNQGGTPAASLISGDWKLIKFFEDNRLELYHLPDDPGESRNLTEAQPELTRSLHALLQEWQRDVEAKIPEPNPDYEAKFLRPKIPNNAHE
ncbi:MAG: sulfatase [Kiritimatiellae bacterium]|jgi:arylsulfatase A-like enzyme|nr:sulfatase [Kiritimatiellia bacterium]